MAGILGSSVITVIMVKAHDTIKPLEVEVGPDGKTAQVTLTTLSPKEASPEELWQGMQILREELVERGALCTNCGCLMREGQPHQVGGFGHCVIKGPIL